MLLETLTVLGAYIVGATPFGFVVGKLRGVDIRQVGSGNIGATNVLRTFGKPLGLLVFLLDFLKGLVPALLAKLWFPDAPLVPILAALATILGHNYTFWLGFKGGKGIATSAGALVALMPIAVLGGGLVWLVTYYTTRYVAVASMVGAVSVPVVLAVQQAVTGSWNRPLLGPAVFIALMAIYRHKSNIRNLLAGTEHQFERKKKP